MKSLYYKYIQKTREKSKLFLNILIFFKKILIIKFLHKKINILRIVTILLIIKI